MLEYILVFYSWCINNVNMNLSDDGRGREKDEMEFIEAAAVLFMAVICFVYVCNSIYIRTPGHRNMVQPVEKFIKGIPDNLEIMNTGSNHAYNAIDWSIVGVNGFSLASGAQSLSWDYRLVTKYRHKIEKGKILLIVLSNLVFGFLEYPQDSANRRYYYFLEPAEIPHGTWWKKIKYKSIPVLASWKNFIHCFFHRGVLFKEHEPSLAYAEEQSDLRIAGWKAQFQLKDLQSRESLAHLQGDIKEATGLLRRMIDESRADGVVPILMLPPLSSVINKKLGEDFIKAVLLEPVAEIASDVPFLNYMYDERFQDYRYYYNGDFMNQAGREKFMPVLWHDIQKAAGEAKL